MECRIHVVSVRRQPIIPMWHSFVAQAGPETTAMAIEEDRSAEALGEVVPSDVNEGEVRATAMEVEENEDDDADKTTGVLLSLIHI